MSHIQVPLTEIWRDNSFNTREAVNAGGVVSLARSISEKGLLQAPVVRGLSPIERKENNYRYKYKLLAGFRRTKAIQELGWTEVEVKVIETRDPLQDFAINFLENHERKDLTLLEEALAIKPLFEQKLTLKKMSELLQVSISWIQFRVELLKLPEFVHEAAGAGQIGVTHVRELYKLQSNTKSSGAEDEEIESAVRKLFLAYRDGKGKKSVVQATGDKTRKRRREKKELEDVCISIVEQIGHCIVSDVLSWAAGNMTTQEIEDKLVEHFAEDGYAYDPEEQA